MFTVPPVAELRKTSPAALERTALSCTGAAVFSVVDDTSKRIVAIVPSGRA
jgi:hypothetical protein